MSIPHLAQEDIGSLELALFDYIKKFNPNLDENTDWDDLCAIVEKHLDPFSIGYRNYN